MQNEYFQYFIYNNIKFRNQTRTYSAVSNSQLIAQIGRKALSDMPLIT